MESLDSLKIRLRDAERDLEKITKRKYGDVQWAPGDYDGRTAQPSFSYNGYTDPSKARDLKNKIEYLKEQIDTYPNREEIERKQRESKNPTYEYTAGGEKETTNNPAMAARYDAQHRFFEMGKMRKAFTKINGQYKKFGKLWDQALESDNEKEQQEIAQQLNKLFR